MGLIQAGLSAIGNQLADQWKEYFYCDSIERDILMTKGQKRVVSGSNTRGSDNIITKGSGVVVNEGQCMMIVDDGEIVEFCDKAGKYTYDSSTSPSVFSDSLGQALKDSIKDIWQRIQYGGDVAKDQRIYYFNTKEITDNKFGTANPILFRVVDSKINLDLDVDLRCNGIYSYKITNPVAFYKNVCGNVSTSFRRGEIDSTLKTEFVSALAPALAALSDLEIRPNQIPAHTMELADSMNTVLTKKWAELRGITVVSVAMNPITLSEQDMETIRTFQKNAMLKDPAMAAATLTGAQAQAMQDAAKNSAGAMTGFMGLGMAQTAGGINAQNLYAMAQQQQQAQPAPAQPTPAQAQADSWKCECGKIVTGKFCPECGAKKPEPKPAADSWVCPTCGKNATGKFCPECGTKKPEATKAEGWTCSCGAVNKSKFCSECGAKKPADAPLYRCDKCGWEPEDPKNPPKFCPECGDRFDDNDIQ